MCAEGIHREPVFADDQDRVVLNLLIARVIRGCGAKIHGYAWLPRQMLMILSVPNGPPSSVLRRITAPHARRVNRKLGYKGRLFEHPRATLLEDSTSLLKAVAVVALCPVHAGLVADAVQYFWSSHRAYLGLEQSPWLTQDTVLKLLGPQRSDPYSSYEALVRAEKTWIQSICGESLSSAFFSWLAGHRAERTKPASLEQLIDAVCRWCQVTRAAINSPATSPPVCLARALITGLATQHNIAGFQELAERLHRSRSTLHELRGTYRRRAPHLFGIPLNDILSGSAAPVDLPSVLRRR